MPFFDAAFEDSALVWDMAAVVVESYFDLSGLQWFEARRESRENITAVTCTSKLQTFRDGII